MKPFFSRNKLFLSALLLLLSVLCGGVALAALQNPRLRLLRAADKTFTKEYLGFSPKEASDLLQQDEFAARLELTLNRLELDLALPFGDPSLLEGLGVSSSFLIDQSLEQLSTEAEITYLLAPYAHLEAYAGPGRLAVRIPELFDSYVQASPETLGRDYNASRLAELTDFRLPENLSLKFFPDGNAAQAGQEDIGKAFYESLTVQKSPDGEDAFFAGENVEAFELTFSSVLLSRILGLPETKGQTRLLLPDSCTVYLKDGYLYGARFPVRLENSGSSHTALCRVVFEKASCRLQASIAPEAGSKCPETINLDAALALGNEEASPLRITLERLDISLQDASSDTSGGFCSLYGSLTLSPAAEPVLAPDEAACLPLFELSARDCLRLLDEMWGNLSSSGLSFLKGFFS